MTAMAPTRTRAAGDPIVSLIEAYRERGDRRAVEQIFSMNVKILNHIVPGNWCLDSSCGTAALELRRPVGTVGSHGASQGARRTKRPKVWRHRSSWLA
jgi:hypothetical protein